MWDVLGIAAIAMLMVAAVSLQFDIAPRNLVWRRRWAWFVYSVMGLFLVWMVILFGFIK